LYTQIEVRILEYLHIFASYDKFPINYILMIRTESVKKILSQKGKPWKLNSFDAITFKGIYN
jgi:hypothetical protein